MHFNAEVIIPPTAEIEEKLRHMLSPFDENNDESHNPFFDYWIFGGRWSGDKLKAQINPDELQGFYDWMKEQKITVSSLVAGKETLSPPEQADKINAEWSKRFPRFAGVCPIFDNYNDSSWDICAVKDIPKRLTCHTLIIGVPHWKAKDCYEVEGLKHQEIWNGIEHQKTDFDGNVIKGIADYNKRLSRYKADWKERCAVRDDWLCITLDYHR